MTGPRTRHVVAAYAAAAAGIAALCYLPVLANGFVRWDDHQYIYENPDIQRLSLASLRWMFTTFHASNYHPLTWLSHGLDVWLWGLRPAGHHLTSLLLHAANTGLVVLVVHGLVGRARPAWTEGGWAGAAALAAVSTGLLFGLHPLRVESVAWASERKDVLYALFELAALLAYLRHAARDARPAGWYGAALLLFAAALLAKPMAISTPIVLLLLDRYPLGRLAPGGRIAWPVVAEKAPFVALGAASAWVTLRAQASGAAMATLDTADLGERLASAAHAVGFYIIKTVWPCGLSPLYEYQPLGPTGAAIWVAAVVAISAAALWLWRRGQPLIGTAWAYYLVTLAPVLGVVQVGRQFAADRYTYLASLGLLVPLGVGIARLWLAAAGSRRQRLALAGGVALALAASAAATMRQIGVWRDEGSLWSHALAVDPVHSFTAHNHLLAWYGERGDLERAARHYRKVLAINPTFLEAVNRMGLLYAERGRLREAQGEFQRAIRTVPLDPDGHINLGHVLLARHRPDAAVASLERAIALDPTRGRVFRLLGQAHALRGANQAAAAAFERALQLDPSDRTARRQLATIYLRLGRYDDARETLRAAAD